MFDPGSYPYSPIALARDILRSEANSLVPRSCFRRSKASSFLAARDFLQSCSSYEQLMSVRPKLSPHVRLEQISQQEDGGWRNKSVTLKLVKGFPYSWRVQPLVVEFLGGCDGRKTLQELTSEFAVQVTAPPERVCKECLDLVRVLIAPGFVHW